MLCPTMTINDKETLVALATAGIINWQEDDSENTHTNTHTNVYLGIFELEPSHKISGLCVTDVYGYLVVLLCCLKASTEIEEEVVQAVLATVMEWRNSKEEWFLFGR